MVKIWENKNAQRALRGAGLSTMALSLAACGSESSDPVVDEPVVEEPTPTGNALVLTDDDAAGVDADRLTGDDFTAYADTITATSAQVDATDLIIEDTAGDGDVLNITATGAVAAATIVGIENINVTLDVFAGAGAAIDATNIEGATITLSSTKLGFDGAGQVSVAGDNNVVAGTGITDLIVTDLGAGVVDTGSADTLTVDTEAVDEAGVYFLTVNGDVAVDLTLDTAAATDTVEVTITGTAASVVDLTALTVTTAFASATQATINTVGDVTLQGDADFFTGTTMNVGALVLDAATGGALDAEDISATSISVQTTDTIAISEAQGQTISIDEADADVAVSGDGSAGSSVTVNVTEDQATAASLTVDGVASSTINFGAAVEDVANVMLIEGAATVSVAGTTTFADINRTAATDSLTLTGAGDITISDTDIDTINSAAATGALALTSTTDGDFDITAGAGDTDIVLNAVTDGEVDITFGNGTNTLTMTGLDEGIVAVTGGSGAETITLGGTAIGTTAAATVALELGGGDDTVALGNLNAANSSMFAIDFGAGDDTLELTATDDLSGEDFNFVGLENIDIGAGVTMAAAQVSGESYNFLGNGAGATLSLVGTANADTVDLSSLTFDGTVGAAVTDVEIDLGAGADTVTLSSADDTIIIDVVANDGIDTVIGFDAANDVFSTGNALAADGDVIDATGTDYDTGNATLAAALADAVADHSVAATENAIVFNYAGDQYVVVSDAGDQIYTDAADVVIKINGVDAADLTAANFI